MALVKLLQASDIHEEDDKNLPRYHAIRALAEKEHVDALLLLGDFFAEQDLKKSQTLEQKIGKELQGRFSKEVLADVQAHQIVAQGVDQVGSVEQLQKLLKNPSLPEDKKKELSAALSHYDKNQQRIGKSIEKLNNDPWLQQQEEGKLTHIIQEAAQRYSRLDAIFKDTKMPVLAVRGNWDLDPVYGMKNVRFVEKEEKPIAIKGLTFVGAPNWYERLASLHPALYEQAEVDPVGPQEIAAFIEEHGTKEDLESYVRSVQAKKPQFPSALKNKLPVYNRLQQKADILLTHKGPGLMAVEGKTNAGSGLGLEYALREKVKPTIILGGHMHRGFFTDKEGYQALRSGDKKVYVSYVDNTTKKITKIIVYSWADRTKERKHD